MNNDNRHTTSHILYGIHAQKIVIILFSSFKLCSILYLSSQLFPWKAIENLPSHTSIIRTCYVTLLVYCWVPHHGTGAHWLLFSGNSAKTWWPCWTNPQDSAIFLLVTSQCEMVLSACTCRCMSGDHKHLSSWFCTLQKTKTR